jgi:NAD(P)-dependent dehydrogenase (short-subunit alcohol dehydrogenase family)
MAMPPSPFSLSGKRILVTGASSGIGRAVAMAVAGMGAAVVVTGRNQERLDDLLVALPGAGHLSHRADLTQAEDREALGGAFEGCHGMVHAAGALKLLPFSFTREKGLREMQAINYEAPLLLTQLLLKKKRIHSGGSIVFISSVAARRGAKGHALYSGSKAALEGAARCLALEVAGQKIRVNCVAPGMVRTAMADEATAAVGDEAMKRHEEEYPLGFGQPDDVAHCAGFLLADASAWVTGTVLVCDGGLLAGR